MAGDNNADGSGGGGSGAAAAATAPSASAASRAASMPMPTSMADSLTFASPEEALRSLAVRSEELALGLAGELDGMLGAGGGTKGSGLPFAPLPDSIAKAAAAAAATANDGDDDDSDLYSGSSSKLQTALVCSESILSSLAKVASGGSKASTEMRSLENERRQVDDEADAIAAALRLRELASGAADALTGRRYADAVKMVAEFDRIMDSTAFLGGGGDDDGGETKE